MSTCSEISTSLHFGTKHARVILSTSACGNYRLTPANIPLCRPTALTDRLNLPVRCSVGRVDLAAFSLSHAIMISRAKRKQPSLSYWCKPEEGLLMDRALALRDARRALREAIERTYAPTAEEVAKGNIHDAETRAKAAAKRYYAVESRVFSGCAPRRHQALTDADNVVSKPHPNRDVAEQEPQVVIAGHGKGSSQVTLEHCWRPAHEHLTDIACRLRFAERQVQDQSEAAPLVKRWSHVRLRQLQQRYTTVRDQVDPRVHFEKLQEAEYIVERARFDRSDYSEQMDWLQWPGWREEPTYPQTVSELDRLKRLADHVLELAEEIKDLWWLSDTIDQEFMNADVCNMMDDNDGEARFKASAEELQTHLDGRWDGLRSLRSEYRLAVMATNPLVSSGKLWEAQRIVTSIHGLGLESHPERCVNVEFLAEYDSAMSGLDVCESYANEEALETGW